MQTADPVLRELGLSNEQAGKLLPLAQGVARTQEACSPSFRRRRRAEARLGRGICRRPEIGGARRAESEHLAARGLDALGFTPDIRSARPWPTAALATTPT
jgi:hypothetical protein